jgi:hypothetical protein
MIADLSKELDKLALRILQENSQPYGAGVDIAYEAGRRIGMAQGVQRARQALIDFHSRDDEKDNDL